MACSHGHSHGDGHGHGHSHGGHGHSHEHDRHGGADEHQCMSNPLEYLRFCYAPKEDGELAGNVRRTLALLSTGDIGKEVEKALGERANERGGEPQSLVDLGCGPCVHTAACLSRQFDRIYLAEYLDKNRQLVEGELAGSDIGFDWAPYYKIIAEHEGTAGGPEAVKARLAHTVQKVVPCDVSKPRAGLPDDGTLPDKFDMVVCIGVLLAVAADTESQFAAALGNVASLLRPGGVLLYGDVAEQQHEDGHTNYVALSKEKVLSHMEKCGFHPVSWHELPANEETWEPDEFLAVFRYCRYK